MDPQRLKCGALVYESRVVPNPKGAILHGLRRSDPGFVDFGEAYFSTIAYGQVKGWKKHLRMAMNIVVPVGRIRFHLAAEDSIVEQVDLGDVDYRRLHVPPGIWMAFEGLGESINLLMNVASIEHDPTESIGREFAR